MVIVDSKVKLMVYSVFTFKKHLTFLSSKLEVYKLMFAAIKNSGGHNNEKTKNPNRKTENRTESNCKPKFLCWFYNRILTIS